MVSARIFRSSLFRPSISRGGGPRETRWRGPPGQGSHHEAGEEAKLRRRALLGGPDAPEQLRDADVERETHERSRGLLFYLAVVVFVAVCFAWSWSENGLADLWNLIWFVPLVLFGALIYYGLEKLGGALCRRAARPFRTHTYTSNFYGDEEEDSDFAEIVDDSTETLPEDGR